MSVQKAVQITDAYSLPHVAYYCVLGAAQIRTFFLQDMKDRLTLCVTNPEKKVVWWAEGKYIYLVNITS